MRKWDWLKNNKVIKLVIKESLTDLPESYAHAYPLKL